MGGSRRFRRLVSITMVLMMVFSFFSTSVFAAQKTDISGHWAEKEINEWFEKGLIGGYSDGSFKPNGAITRAEFIALVNRAFGFDESSEGGFTDIFPSDWYYSEILKAKAAGYIGGYEDGSIKPNNNISRQEVAAILARLASVESRASSVDQFNDKDNIPTWSRGVVGGVVDAGFMRGYEDGTFKPFHNTTRAEAVVILNRALKDTQKPSEQEKVYDTAGVYGPEEGLETVAGNVKVTASGVTLRNMVIEGDLTISEEVGNGDAFLKGVTVKGKTYVNGGGENSIHFEDTVLITVIVNKEDGTVRIVATGKTSVQEVILHSSAKVEQDGTEGIAFKEVTLAENLPANSKVTLIGNFESVNILATTFAVEIPKGSIQEMNVAENATDANITVAEDAKIVSLILDSVVKVIGQGTIEKAEGKAANDSTYEKKPNNMAILPSGGGGGGGGGNPGGGNPPDDQNPEPTTPESITLEYLGHSAFILTTDEKKILIDPWDPISFGLPNYILQNEEEINLINITHFHDDHSYAKAAPTALEAGQIIQGVIWDEEELESYFNEIKNAKYGDVFISSMNLYHFPNTDEFKLEDGSRRIENSGFIYQTANMRMVNMGDAMGTILDGLTNEEIETLKGSVGIDILIVPIGDWAGNSLNSEAVIKAIKDLSPKVVIPVHSWGTKNTFLTAVEEDGTFTIEKKTSVVTFNKSELPTDGTVIWDMNGTFDNNVPGFFVLPLKGDVPNSTQILTFGIHPGNSAMIKVQEKNFAIPIVGSDVPEDAIPYTSGSDIENVSVGDHAGLYEVDSNGKVVGFVDITLTEENILLPEPSELAVEEIITLDVDDSKSFGPGDGFQVVFNNDIHTESQIEINTYLKTDAETIIWIGTEENGMQIQWVDNRTLQVIIGIDGLLNIMEDEYITLPKEIVYDTQNIHPVEDIVITLSKPASFPPKFETWMAETGDNIGEITLTVDLDEEGKVYYVVVPNGSKSPTVEQIIAGVDYDDVTVSASGTIAVDDPVSEVVEVVEGLIPGELYDVYFAAEDNEETPNIQMMIKQVLSVEAKVEDLYIISASTYDSFEDGTIDSYLVMVNRSIIDPDPVEVLNKITVNDKKPTAFITGYGVNSANDNLFWLEFEEIEDTGALPSLIIEAGAITDHNGIPNITQIVEESLRLDGVSPKAYIGTTNDTIQLDLRFSEDIDSIDIVSGLENINGEEITIVPQDLRYVEMHITNENGGVQTDNSFVFVIYDFAGNYNYYKATLTADGQWILELWDET
ncbi:S-layer homology domain-containing protein [Calidifontibacillus erzurumensis]|uniref:S-layer homology domain-containing protein n=1 Tax=Calidifontibacillus erzurumensis TaxID=2741433 RepID=A0A8J8KEI6_9BACI|nr:S-layer homology domain-containing protein [Calidifontibacillus erzurumensis]NSL51865.1 S-layer homology domain-containing protein [Calidifontibacillus erzurumensis]